MEGDEAVAGGDVGVALRLGHVAVVHEDVRAIGDGALELRELARLALAPVDALQDERRALARCERLRERLDDAERVLALRADEVEDEEEEEAWRETQIGTRRARRGRRFGWEAARRPPERPTRG